VNPVATLDERLGESLRSHGWLPSGTPLVLGVSGGSDSMALMALLTSLTDAFDWPLEVVHVHHGLRGHDADADAAFVAEWAERLGVACRVVRVDLAHQAGQSVEMAARTARRSVLLERAEADGGLLVLGHQANDQAETILLRILRGTGVGGLGAMRPVAGSVRRPLLHFWRDDLTEYLRARRVPWREDATNDDLAIPRNRVRHELLPALRSFNPRIDEALIRLGESAATLDEWAADETRRWLGAHLEVHRERRTYRLVGLGGMPRALQVRAMRAIAARRGASLTEAQVSRALLGPTTWPGGTPVTWDGGDLVVRAPSVDAAPGWPEEPIRVRPPETPLPMGALAVAPAPPGVRGVLRDKRLWVRQWRPGDRIRMAGVGRKKLQDVFVDAKVPREWRALWPVVVASPDGDRVVSVPGLVDADEFLDEPGRGWRLVWRRSP
jgi:tRNA(Ile)-lysidine synthase